MKKLLFIIVLFGCKSISKQERDADYFYKKYPEKLAAKCTAEYPPTVSYKAGETITKFDTSFIPGDSVSCPPSINGNDTIYTKVKCPDSKTIFKTVTRIDTISKIDNAMVALLLMQRDKINADLISSNTLLSERTKKLKTESLIIFGLLALIIIGIILKIKKIL